LEKTSKIIKSNRQPNTTMPAKPCPKVQYLHIILTPPGMGLNHFPRQPIPMLDHSFSKFFLISNLNLPWCSLRPLPLVLSLVTCEKRPTPASLLPPFRFQRAIRSPL